MGNSSWCLLVVTAATLAAQPVASAEDQEYELKFLTRMIGHHATGVMLADLCLEKAVHTELSKFCQTVRKEQSEELGTLQGWLLAWYHGAYEPEPSKSGQAEKLAHLMGEEFEREFIPALIRHEQQALEESRVGEKRALHMELRTFCHQLQSRIAQEIRTLQAWHCTWYMVCTDQPTSQPAGALTVYRPPHEVRRYTAIFAGGGQRS